ncbi:MAG: LuxR C-terminal-related transcriptional regulator, partial [Ignavibacteriaceae bacterium]
VKSEVKEYDNTGENLLREVYSVGYKTSENKLPHDNLSFRELQVMKLIALGKARKEIAEELFLSISTINTYRARILDKMNMKNNAEIMRYAFQHKFVE